MTLKTLIFDFDGVILDTETPEFRAWQTIYREYGQELPIEEWIKIVGGVGVGRFDAAAHLAELTQGGADAALLRARQRSESDALILIQPVMPGVIDILDEARARGLGLVIASSSPHDWVDSHLTRVGLFDRFDRVICSEDVPPGRTKPNPDLFLKALEVTQAHADEAVVFEDSFNGVKAARAAGIFVVAVPNSVTSLLGVDGANLTLESLSHLQFSSLMSSFTVQ